MVSETPIDGRCAKKVTTFVGLEIHDSDAGVVYVDRDVGEDDVPKESDVAGSDGVYGPEVRAVVLADDDGHESEVEPDYWDVMDLLTADWFVDAVIVTNETDNAISHERISVDDDDPYVTNRTSVVDGYCEKYPMEHGFCNEHYNGGGGEGGYGRPKHGLYMQRSKFIEWLKENDRDEDVAFIHAMVNSWIDDAPFDHDNVAKVNELYRAAVDQLRLWLAVDESVDIHDDPGTRSGEYSGLAYEQVVDVSDDGDVTTAIQESPLNLPYSRLDRDVQSKLKNMGIYDSPEQQEADATMTIAKAMSGSDAN